MLDGPEWGDEPGAQDDIEDADMGAMLCLVFLMVLVLGVVVLESL